MKRILQRCREKGFTLLELLTVVAIIIVLAGLILSGMGYAQQKAASERARAEIAALSLALESYKIDNGDYPRYLTADAEDSFTDTYQITTGTAVPDGSKVLYRGLVGDSDGDGKTDTNAKVYFQFKADMLSTGTATPTDATHIIDPFGYAYGYSTYANKQTQDGATIAVGKGYNATFDLWSTGGQTAASGTGKWITNW